MPRDDRHCCGCVFLYEILLANDFAAATAPALLTPSSQGSATPMIASIIGPKNFAPNRPKMEGMRSSAGFCTHAI